MPITDPERNYHRFYQLCASERNVEKYKLGHPCHFHYLNQSKVYELDGISSAEEYMKTRRAMDIVGISHEDQEAMFRTLAAILHLGNIEFSPGKEHDSSVIKDEKSIFHMQMAANLFVLADKINRSVGQDINSQIQIGVLDIYGFECFKDNSMYSRWSSMYWDDKYGTQSVSNEVVSEMREIVSKDNQNLPSNSFLLDDDLSISFSSENNTCGNPGYTY